MSVRAYQRKALSLGLTRRRAHAGMIHMDRLSPVTDPHVAYALGFLWADGSLRQDPYRMVTVSAVETDMADIRETLEHLGQFTVRRVHQHTEGVNRKPQTQLYTHDQAFCRFMADMGYATKSTDSPDRIITYLDEPMRRSFWHGYFDGDGCLSLDRKQCTTRASFAGSYIQRWDAVIAMLEGLDIHGYRVRPESYTTKDGAVHRCSKVAIGNRPEVIKLMTYLMADPVPGLSRKREKVRELAQWAEWAVAFNHGKGVPTHRGRRVIRSDGQEYATIRDAARAVPCDASCVSEVLAGERTITKGFGFRYATG